MDTFKIKFDFLVSFSPLADTQDLLENITGDYKKYFDLQKSFGSMLFFLVSLKRHFYQRLSANRQLELAFCVSWQHTNTTAVQNATWRRQPRPINLITNL